MQEKTNHVNVEQHLKDNPFLGNPQNLYDAMNYIMQIGGKRLRPQLLILSYLSQKHEVSEDALNLALSIETFHNFSLVHDDIMDNAPIRRGQGTVHEKWNAATAILAGDNLLIKCYELILNTNFINRIPILKEFSTMAIQVCEGQQMDMNLPEETDVNEAKYLEMIMKKTAVLPATALKMGAMAAESSDSICQFFYEFGLNLGLAFQLQDDYLDAFGQEHQIGKQEGGDIIENKKTILYLNSLKNLNPEEQTVLLNLYQSKSSDNAHKINTVRALFEKSGSKDYLIKLKTKHEHLALEFLDKITMHQNVKNQFLELFHFLKNREN